MVKNLTFKSMKVVLVVIISSLTSSFVHAEKLCEFKEPFKYVIFAMDDDQIYIADRGTNIVHIYSREDYSHIAQFGGLGQGPTEFETIAFKNKKLVFGCGGQVSLFMSIYPSNHR